MDPVTLAAAAIAVIRPLLGKFASAAADKAAGAAADAAGSSAQRLFKAVRERMTSDSYHAAILQGADDQPGSEDRIETLSRTLAAVIRTDPAFASAIEDMIGQASQAVTVTDSGAVAGRDVNITATNAAGRDIIIGGSA